MTGPLTLKVRFQMCWESKIPFHCRRGPSWPWLYGSLIYNYLCDQCLSPMMLWVRISIRPGWGVQHNVIKFVKWLATDRWFSPGPLVSFTNKTDCHDIIEILLKVALNTIKTNKQCRSGLIREEHCTSSSSSTYVYDIHCFLNIFSQNKPVSYVTSVAMEINHRWCIWCRMFN